MKGTPSRLSLQMTQRKQPGWYDFPRACRIYGEEWVTRFMFLGILNGHHIKKQKKKNKRKKKERTFWWVNWVIITAQNSLRQITQQNTRSKLTYQTNHKDWPNFNTFYLQQEKLRNLLYSAYWMVNICRLMPTEILYFLTCDDITSGCF